jgi:hypothetical protein
MYSIKTYNGRKWGKKYETYQAAYQAIRKLLRQEFPAAAVGRISGQPPITPGELGFKIVRTH